MDDVALDIDTLFEEVKQQQRRNERTLARDGFLTISRVREPTRNVRPDEYTPHYVPIGPYHWSQRRIDEKRTYLNIFLDAYSKNTKNLDKRALLVNLLWAMKNLDASSCYSDGFDGMGAENEFHMLLLDGCYLLALFADSLYRHKNNVTPESEAPQEEEEEEPLTRTESATGATEEQQVESVTGAAEEQQVESATGAAEEQPVESATGAAEEQQVESAATGAAEEQPVECATGATEEQPVESATGAAEEQQVESAATGAAEEQQVESATGAAEEQQVESAATGAAEEQPVESATGATEEQPVENATGAAEEQQVESAATGAAEEQQVESATGATEEQPVESATGAAEEQQVESATGAAEEQPVESATGAVEEQPVESVNDGKVRDILYLLENQIPFFVVQKIYDLVTGESPSSALLTKFAERVKNLLQRQLYIRKTETAVGTPAPLPESNPSHLLHLVRTYFPEPQVGDGASASSGTGRWHRAMEYCSYANVRFHPRKLDDGAANSVLDVRLAGGKLLVPLLRVDNNTWTILRNLMALEEHHAESLKRHVTAYCLFMSQLACTEEDVKLLVRRRVVEHFLGSDAEVAAGFADLCKGVVLDVNDLNSNYLKPVWHKLERRYRSRWQNLVSLFRQTHVRNLLYAAAFVVAVIVFASEVLQGIFTVMGYFLK